MRKITPTKNKLYLSYTLKTTAAISALVLVALGFYNHNKPQTIQNTTLPTNANNRSEPNSETNAEKLATSLPQAPHTYPEANRRTPATLGEEPFAESLEGTEIDGQLSTDEHGNLIIDLAARDFFDYFLNTAGEVGFENVVTLLKNLIHQSLGERAAQEAITLLNDYIEYKSAVTLLSAQPVLQKSAQTQEYYLHTLQTTFAELKSLRRDIMSEQAVEAFFSLEEAYGEFTLESMRINMDQNLDPSTKEQLIEHRRSFLPTTIRNTDTRIIADSTKSNEVLAAINSNATDETLASTLAEKSYSQEHIDSVIAYRQQQRQFEQTYQDYSQERERLIKQGANKATLSELRRSYFSSNRQLTQARLKDLN